MKTLTENSGVDKLSSLFKEGTESLKDSNYISDIQKAIRSLFMVSSLALGSIGLNGCNGGDGLITEDTVGASKTTSRFIDGDVEGLTVTDEHGNVSLTDENGTFSIDKGGSVTFSVGNVDIGSIDQNEITGEDSFLHNLLGITAEESINNPRASAIARFLQTIDYDSDHSNGIQITKETRDILANYLTGSGEKLDFETTDVNNLEQELNYIATIVGKALVSKGDAIKNFTDILISYGIITKEYAVNNTSGIYVTENTGLLDDTTTPTVETNTTTPTVETNTTTPTEVVSENEKITVIDKDFNFNMVGKPGYEEDGRFKAYFTGNPGDEVYAIGNTYAGFSVDDEGKFSADFPPDYIANLPTGYLYNEISLKDENGNMSKKFSYEVYVEKDDNGENIITSVTYKTLD